MENEEVIANAFNLDISTKYSVEIANNIRGKTTERAKKILQDAIDMKIPIRITRFKEGAGHKRGNFASGKYPINASKEILSVIKQAESNVRDKGGSTQNLVISGIIVNKAANTPRYGRQRGIRAKKTHLEIKVKEVEGKKREAKKIVKPEVKKEVKEVKK